MQGRILNMVFDEVLNGMKNKTILVLSHAFLICFSCLMFIGYKFPIPYCLQALLEFYAKPNSVLLLTLLSINIVKLYLEKWSIKSEYFLSTLILFAIITLDMAIIFNI